jgi:capsular exopolysaccharide synthesis family protein
MINPIISEPKSESVDVKEYVAILLKRKWLILVCFLLSMAGTTAFLFTRQPIYRANAKLLVTTTGSMLPVADVTREDEYRFYATQVDIMLSQPMLKRVQQRMKKTADEVRENLVDLQVAPVRGSSIILVTVDSPSTDFAKEFTSALCEEYLRFREEQRAESSESALLMLTREINRLSQELKAANERMLAYAKEHNMMLLERTTDWYYKRFYSVANRLAGVSVQLAEIEAKKELLEARPDAATVLALLGTGSGAALPATDGSPIADVEKEADKATTVIRPGDTLSIAVQEDPRLDQRVEVSEIGTAEYLPLGLLNTDGLTPDELATQIKQEIEKAGTLQKATVVVSREVAPQAPAAQKSLMETLTEGQHDISAVNMATPSLKPTVQPSELDSSPGGLNKLALGVISDAQGQRLFDLEARRRSLQSRLDEMRRLYKAKHPALQETEAQLEEVTRQIDSEIEFIRQKVAADWELAKVRMEQSKAMAEQISKEALADSARVLEIQGMKGDASRIESLYNALLAQLMKIDVSQSFNARTVSVLERATLEQEPVYPKKMKGLLVAAFFGLGLGLALAFFIEYIDDSIKLAEEVERDLQLPFLGMIPAAQWNPDDLSAHRLDKLKQQGGVAEAYRVVRSAIIFSIPREKLRTILLTSAVPREGKTTTCVNLSIGFAQTEERVLLIDADLRRGEIHKYFGVEKDKGLVDVLLGEATPEEVIRKTDVPRLDVITVGSYPANPAELLLGWRLKELLEWSKKHYDRVIIDCTPVMGIADSAILGSAVDGVLFIIWAGRTSRRYVRVAKMTAVSRGAKVFGFVLNNLEPGRVGYYHYYPYYYSYYSRGYYYAHKDEEQGKGGDIKGIEVPTQDESKNEMDDVY